MLNVFKIFSPAPAESLITLPKNTSDDSVKSTGADALILSTVGFLITTTRQLDSLLGRQKCFIDSMSVDVAKETAATLGEISSVIEKSVEQTLMNFIKDEGQSLTYWHIMPLGSHLAEVAQRFESISRLVEQRETSKAAKALEHTGIYAFKLEFLSKFLKHQCITHDEKEGELKQLRALSADPLKEHLFKELCEISAHAIGHRYSPDDGLRAMVVSDTISEKRLIVELGVEKLLSEGSPEKKQEHASQLIDFIQGADSSRETPLSILRLGFDSENPYIHSMSHGVENWLLRLKETIEQK